MITHLVLFKLKPGIAPSDPRFAAVQAAMAALPGKISVIRSWQHGVNLTPDAEAWDYGLIATFECEADLHAYFDHPAHLPVVAQWNEIATLAFADLAV
ncbi:Dabb family protein [Sulfuricystis multivorans]|uniref:Dabb family protein n=1 Tax=Sulfuricystis multivorans TaxID=2211108 RepID=UPI000F84DA01|nr:Dabb family protein [Sulfuricystis multivorans]